LVVLVSAKHKLAKQNLISAEELSKETFISFPIPLERMDILNHFLNPAKLKPAGIKNVESIELMLQMTEFGRGVCVLPEWLAEESIQKHDLKKLQIGNHGIGKELYIAVRNPDTEIKYIQEFIQTGKDLANQNLGVMTK